MSGRPEHLKAARVWLVLGPLCLQTGAAPPGATLRFTLVVSTAVLFIYGRDALQTGFSIRSVLPSERETQGTPKDV